MDDQLGSIFIPPHITAGSAFAFGPHKEIVTCAHVLVAALSLPQGTNIFYASELSVKRLHLKYALPKFDLAVLSPDSEILGEPFAIGDFNKMRPGDQIVYIGYDQKASVSNQDISIIHAATVTATGAAMNDGRIINFIEFQGEGLPGYSGGPVFNYKGELVAVIREAWTKKGVKGGPEVLINRAFSLDILQTLDGEVFSENPKNAADTNKVTTLIDVIGSSDIREKSAGP